MKHKIILILIICILASSFVSASIITHTWDTESQLKLGDFSNKIQLNLDNTGVCDAKRYFYLGYVSLDYFAGYYYPGINVNPQGICNQCPGSGTVGISSMSNVFSGQDPFSECNGVSCSNYYGKTGMPDPFTIERCYSKLDEPASTHYCSGSGSCQSAAEVCPYNDNSANLQRECGICQHMSGGSCTGIIPGSCSNYGPSYSCGTRNCDSLDTICRNYHTMNKYCSGGSCINPSCNSYTNTAGGTNCGIDKECDGSGNCVSICIPDCTGKECGDDGCGGICGTCAADEICNSADQCEIVWAPETISCDIVAHCRQDLTNKNTRWAIGTVAQSFDVPTINKITGVVTYPGGYTANDFPAFKVCEDATYGGYTNWRLPEFDELESLRSTTTNSNGAYSDLSQIYAEHGYWTSQHGTNPGFENLLAKNINFNNPWGSWGESSKLYCCNYVICIRTD